MLLQSCVGLALLDLQQERGRVCREGRLAAESSAPGSKARVVPGERKTTFHSLSNWDWGRKGAATVPPGWHRCVLWALSSHLCLLPPPSHLQSFGLCSLCFLSLGSECQAFSGGQRDSVVLFSTHMQLEPAPVWVSLGLSSAHQLFREY